LAQAIISNRIPLEEAGTTQAPRRAALYLRVSSPGQVRTDYDPEGLSIPAQRQACQRKAAQLGAEVVREYVEPGFSGGSLVKRRRFRQMVDEVSELADIDVVIVWSVARWARNQEDHWVARGLVRRAGAKLISVKEPIGEESAHGVLLEGVMAAYAESQRIEISEEVTRGIRRKIEVGGTHGRAPLGYKNIREPLPQGGEVRTVVIDEERAPLVRWAFETYATGLYSIADMVVLLEARGLRTRGTCKSDPKPPGMTTVNDLLANPYYTGKVRYRGNYYEGRHEALISEELFERVAAVLTAHKRSGERDRKHAHYLKGSIFCGECGRRLTYSRSRGRGGLYEYFICSANKGGGCQQRAQRVDHAEAAIERHYATIRFSERDRERVQRAVESHLANLAGVSSEEIDRCNAVLAGLKEQERKLLRKHYADEISEELFAEEQARIKRERADTETIVGRLTVDHDRLLETLALALQLASYDLQDLYLRATPQIRRLMNQAIFEAIWLSDDEVDRSQLAAPLHETRKLADAVAAAENRKAPDLGSEALDGGWIRTEMVELAGLEPATFALPARRSPN
jgi:site-specific DNA recombinase